jgi:hypothetical protein
MLYTTRSRTFRSPSACLPRQWFTLCVNLYQRCAKHIGERQRYNNAGITIPVNFAHLSRTRPSFQALFIFPRLIKDKRGLRRWIIIFAILLKLLKYHLFAKGLWGSLCGEDSRSVLTSYRSSSYVSHQGFGAMVERFYYTWLLSETPANLNHSYGPLHNKAVGKTTVYILLMIISIHLW